MENILYNELTLREYDVDVGVVEYNNKTEDKKSRRAQLEVDFIANKNIIPWHDEKGILYLGIEDFLLDEAAMDR